VRALQPVVEPLLLDVRRHPVGELVVGQQPLLDRLDAHKPRGHGPAGEAGGGQGAEEG
jgi:hypothetical protein